jgi:alkylhydroperoxidase family enzyme
MARIDPLSEPYPADVASALAKWMPPGAAVEPLALFRTLYLRPDIADRARPLGAGLLGHGRLPAADRELVINRVCARCAAEYEWGVHVSAFGAAVGLSEAQLAATAAAQPAPELFGDHQQALLRAVDELHDSGTVTDSTWPILAEALDHGQLLELLVLVGWYHLISFVANGARVDLEPWAARFPPRAAVAEP